MAVKKRQDKSETEELRTIERELDGLLSGLNLRRTLDDAIEIGKRLLTAKKLVRFGEWIPWLKKRGLCHSTAKDYMQAAKEANSRTSGYLNATKEAKVGLHAFLRFVRDLKRASYEDQLCEDRKKAAKNGKMLPPDNAYRVVQADCRKYAWPHDLEVIATDPPWRDMEAYRWLASFAASHLREGGLLLVQCGTRESLQVGDILRDAGLVHQWTLFICYENTRKITTTLFHPFVNNSRQVFVFTKGTFDRKKHKAFSDTYTVRNFQKKWHEWEQPLDPWHFWLARLTLPGQTIADPFLGGGTIAVVVKMLGEGRRFIGTDNGKDERGVWNYLVARGRLGATTEDQPASGELAEEGDEPRTLPASGELGEEGDEPRTLPFFTGPME